MNRLSTRRQHTDIGTTKESRQWLTIQVKEEGRRELLQLRKEGPHGEKILV